MKPIAVSIAIAALVLIALIPVFAALLRGLAQLRVLLS